MNTKAVSTPVIVATLIVTVLLACFFGWQYLNGPRLDANGQDLSKAGVQPSGLSYAPKPASKSAPKPASKPAARSDAGAKTTP